MQFPLRAPQLKKEANDHSGRETLAITEQALRQFYGHCKDVAILTSTVQVEDEHTTLTLVFVYCEELCDSLQLRQVIFPMIHDMNGRGCR